MPQRTGKEIMGTVDHMKKNGTFWIVIFGLLAGLIMLFIGSGSFFEHDGEKQEASDTDIEVDAYTYKASLEGEIGAMCKKLSGVNDVFVCVSIGSTCERIYATDKQRVSGIDREEYVIIGSGSDARPLYIGQRMPEISGIGVILTGNNISGLKSQLESMISSSYGVPMNKVWVQIN